MAPGINCRIRAGRPVGLGPPAAGIVTGPPSAATGASGWRAAVATRWSPGSSSPLP